MLLAGNQNGYTILNLLHYMISFLPKIKDFGYHTGMQFINTSLVAGQNNYRSKLVNAYIMHDLDN